MNDLSIGFYNVVVFKYWFVGFIEVGGVEYGQGLVDVVFQGFIGVVGYRVYQAWDEVGGQGNDESL